MELPGKLGTYIQPPPETTTGRNRACVGSGTSSKLPASREAYLVRTRPKPGTEPTTPPEAEGPTEDGNIPDMSFPNMTIPNVNMGLTDAIVDAELQSVVCQGGGLLTPHPSSCLYRYPETCSTHPHTGKDEIEIEIKTGTGSEKKPGVHLNSEAKHHRRPIRCCRGEVEAKRTAVVLHQSPDCIGRCGESISWCLRPAGIVESLWLDKGVLAGERRAFPVGHMAAAAAARTAS